MKNLDSDIKLKIYENQIDPRIIDPNRPNGIRRQLMLK